MSNKITIKSIKEKIPKSYFDAKKVNGIPLRDDWYCISKPDSRGYLLLTTLNNPIVDILKKYFKVEYFNHMWGSAHRYIINIK